MMSLLLSQLAASSFELTQTLGKADTDQIELGPNIRPDIAAGSEYVGSDPAGTLRSVFSFSSATVSQLVSELKLNL